MGASRAMRLALETRRAFNAGDLDGAMAGAALDVMYIDHGLGVAPVGIEAVHAHKAAFRQAFPDIELSELKVEEMGPSGAVIRFVAHGRHDGPFGTLAPTGRRFTIPVCELLTLDPGGRVVLVERYWNQLSLLEQLGVAPLGHGENAAVAG